MRKIITLFVIAAVHLIITIVCGVAEFSTDSFIFTPASPAHGFWSIALQIVEFPLLTITRAQDPMNPPFYPYIMALNSLLWATVIIMGIRLYRSRLSAR